MTSAHVNTRIQQAWLLITRVQTHPQVVISGVVAYYRAGLNSPWFNVQGRPTQAPSLVYQSGPS
jgi:hypothetical protein